MDLINDEIASQLRHALEQWNDLERRGLHGIEAAELVGVRAALATAIRSVPIKAPSFPRGDAPPGSSELRAQAQHLANVARALDGFRHGGKVRPDPIPLHCLGRRWYGLFCVDVTWPVEGWVTYIHVVNADFKKAGKSGDGANFDERMNGSYNCLRKVIGDGPPYLGDPWKRWAPFTLLEGQEVELWAKEQPTHQAAKDEEDILNEFYRGEWSKEGWKNQSRRPLWPAELNRRRARIDRRDRLAG